MADNDESNLMEHLLGLVDPTTGGSSEASVKSYSGLVDKSKRRTTKYTATPLSHTNKGGMYKVAAASSRMPRSLPQGKLKSQQTMHSSGGSDKKAVPSRGTNRVETSAKSPIPGRLGTCRLASVQVNLNSLAAGQSTSGVNLGVSQLIQSSESQRSKLLASSGSSATAQSGGTVLFGCVANRSQPRQSKRGNPYFVLTLTDFASEVALFAFDQAVDVLRRAREGALVAVRAPALVPPQHGDRSRSGFALSVANASNCRVIAYCADFGRCTAKVGRGPGGGRPEARACGRAVNTRVSRLCPEHQLQLMAANGSISTTHTGRSAAPLHRAKGARGPHVHMAQTATAAARGQGVAMARQVIPPASTQTRHPQAGQSDPLALQLGARRSQLAAAVKQRSDLTSFGSSAAASRRGKIATHAARRGLQHGKVDVAASQYASAGCSFDPETAARFAAQAQAQVAGLRPAGHNPRVSGGVAGSYAASSRSSGKEYTYLDIIARRDAAAATRSIMARSSGHRARSSTGEAPTEISSSAGKQHKSSPSSMEAKPATFSPTELISVGSDGRLLDPDASKAVQPEAGASEAPRTQAAVKLAKAAAAKRASMSKRGSLNVAAAVESQAITAPDDTISSTLHAHRKRREAGPGKALAMQRYLEDKERLRRDAQEKRAQIHQSNPQKKQPPAQSKRRARLDFGRVDASILAHARELSGAGHGGLKTGDAKDRTISHCEAIGAKRAKPAGRMGSAGSDSTGSKRPRIQKSGGVTPLMGDLSDVDSDSDANLEGGNHYDGSSDSQLDTTAVRTVVEDAHRPFQSPLSVASPSPTPKSTAGEPKRSAGAAGICKPAPKSTAGEPKRSAGAAGIGKPAPPLSLSSLEGMQALRAASSSAAAGRDVPAAGVTRLGQRLDALERADEAVSIAIEAGQGQRRVEYATIWQCKQCGSATRAKPEVCLGLGHSVVGKRVRCYFHYCSRCSHVSRSFRPVRTKKCRCGAGPELSSLVDSAAARAVSLGHKVVSQGQAGGNLPASGDQLKPCGDGLFEKSLRFG